MLSLSKVALPVLLLLSLPGDAEARDRYDKESIPSIGNEWNSTLAVGETETMDIMEEPRDTFPEWETVDPTMSISPSPSPVAQTGTASPSPVAQAGTACPEGSQFVDRCFDSLLEQVQQSWGGTSIPPDPHGAAGSNSVIAVTNKEIEARTKHGDIIFGPASLASMFTGVITGFTPTNVFDPKIMFDVHESRFVVVVLDRVPRNNVIIGSNILVAVSRGDNPRTTGRNDWYFLKIDSLIDNTWADYPGIAVDEEAVYITNNMFPVRNGVGRFNSLLWIVDKTPFYTGGTAVWNVHDYIAAAGSGVRNTHMPAMVRNATGIAPNVGTYLVAYSGLNGGGTNEAVQIIRINNPLAENPAFTQNLVIVGNIENRQQEFPNAPQPETDELIETGDRRALDAVWVKNELWMVTTVSGADRTFAYWFKFRANGIEVPRIADQGFINGDDIEAGAFTYFPSLDVSSNGVAAFGFAASSPNTIFGSAYATIRNDMTDAPGTVRPPDVVKAGLGPYFQVFGGTSNRWGDYTGMSLDPEDDRCFWAFNEYASGDRDCGSTANGQFGCWKTAWARLCFPATTDSPSASPSQAPSGRMPSASPSSVPSRKPSQSPTDVPSMTPSASPSQTFSDQPSMTPSESPSRTPSDLPSMTPSASPSQTPSDQPSMTPSEFPTRTPSVFPSMTPSTSPSQTPSDQPSMTPSEFPTRTPSVVPSMTPSTSPSQTPSDPPSMTPSESPARTPSVVSSTPPSAYPSQTPSNEPSKMESSKMAPYTKGKKSKSTKGSKEEMPKSPKGSKSPPKEELAKEPTKEPPPTTPLPTKMHSKHGNY